MKTIWKYLIDLGINNLEIPENAKILDVQVQHENVCIWVLVNPTNKKERRNFIVYSTGQEIKEDNINYIGTFQLQKGLLVFHLFEII